MNDVLIVFSPAFAALLIAYLRDLYKRTPWYRRTRVRRYLKACAATAGVLAIRSAPRWQAQARQAALTELDPPRLVPGPRGTTGRTRTYLIGGRPTAA